MKKNFIILLIAMAGTPCSTNMMAHTNTMSQAAQPKYVQITTLFKNVRENESLIIQSLKSYTGTGWNLVSTVPLTLSPGTNGSGIIMTRYLLCK